MEESVITTGLCYSHIGNLHLTLFLTFEYLLSQAIYSLGKHFEYLISYISKWKTQHFYHKVKAYPFAITCGCFSPKHRFLPLQLSEICTHFHTEIRLIPYQCQRAQKEKLILWDPKFHPIRFQFQQQDNSCIYTAFQFRSGEGF